MSQSTANRSFDTWLYDSLKTLRDQVRNEPIPQRLLDLIPQDRQPESIAASPGLKP